MQEIEVRELQMKEIKEMLLISIKDDSYVAKCFIDLILQKRYNKRELKILQEVKSLLNQLKIEEATQLIIEKL